VGRDVLEGFFGGWGRKFYQVERRDERVLLRKGGEKIADVVRSADGIEVVPFRRGEDTWSVEWK
jgi:dihydroorotase